MKRSEPLRVSLFRKGRDELVVIGTVDGVAEASDTIIPAVS